MIRRVAMALVVWGALAGAAWAAAPAMPVFNEEETRTLSAGEPVLRQEQFDDEEGQPAGRGVGYIAVNADAAAIWRVLLDFNRYPEFYPNLHDAKMTKRDGNHFFVFYILDVLGLVKVKYNVDHTYVPEDNRLTWKMDRTQRNDFEETTGFWQVWPNDENKSLVCYSVFIKTGRWVPGFAQTLVEKLGLTTWGLKKVVTCMKKRVELGESYKGEADRKLDARDLPPEAASPPAETHAAPAPTPAVDSSPAPGP